MLNVAFLEAFYTGSHRYFLDGYLKHSELKITAFTLPGRHWKWRMHGAAITFANQLNQAEKEFDVVLATDMIDLSVVKANYKNPKAKYVLYFHENQLTYPWNIDDPDLDLHRDRHYSFINYTSALCADKVLFNSEYHRTSFIQNLPKFLSEFPDFQNLESIKSIEEKSAVVPIGFEIPSFQTKKDLKKPIRILWNHRWEYDKNPHGFLAFLRLLKKRNHAFELVLLGEQMRKAPREFSLILKEFKNDIKHSGFVEDREAYLNLVRSCDILPVTSNQDFFGISVVESILLGVFPLMPNRLAYPEHIPQNLNDIFLYSTEEEMFDKFLKLTSFTLERTQLIQKDLYDYCLKYSWQKVANRLNVALSL